jgi:hypothetical protein
MSKKRDKSHDASPKDPSPANLTYYIVVLVAGMTGFMAYSSGASLERSLTRVLVVLIACTILGYFINLVLWMSSPGRQGTAPAVTTAATSPSGAVGKRVDLVAGDDEETPAPPRHPGARIRGSQAAG